MLLSVLYSEYFSFMSIYLILDHIKYWHDTGHLGLLASAQDSFVNETDLLECYLILKGYYSGFVQVCVWEGTNIKCKSSNSTNNCACMDPCNGMFQVLLLFYQFL